ncbi:MAG: hypothetical protein EPN30_11485 [Actinomycetota bacterium]|nr:MAG: hypothetical protein EPN30_11485 [Actinomycetota bacterium]
MSKKKLRDTLPKAKTGTDWATAEGLVAEPALRALWGWSPPDLPADSALKRNVDRALPRTGLGYIIYWAVVIGLEFGLAPHLPVRGRLSVEGVAALLAGAWCGLNFWRCRHAHCAVSGAGWSALGGLALVEAGMGHSLIGGYDQLVFIGVFVFALVFEGLWYRARGTNALARLGRPRC